MCRSGNELDFFQMLFTGTQVDFDKFKSAPGAADNKAEIQAYFNRITGRTDIEVVEVTWQSEWRANLRMASTFRKGRVFIVGG